VTNGESPRKLLGAAKRIVVKVGSQLIADSPAGRPAAIADGIASLAADGREVVLVSSGAIALGMRLLGLRSRPSDLPTLQAAAATGQTDLMRNWEHAFQAHGRRIAQVLITHDDIAARSRFLNARHALRALLNHGVVPVVNENDTVAVEEIKYGDNDTLAALVCNLVSADALLILTNVDGLLNGPPDQGGERVKIVQDIETEARPLVRSGGTSALGSGGMASKVEAAAAAVKQGVITCVLSGVEPDAVVRAARGDDIGTLFLPSATKLGSRKHWLAYGPRPLGRITVDQGAQQALASGGKSLLPAGVVDVSGVFEMGDIVSLLDPGGTEFARGLAGVSARDLERVMGQQTADIQVILGYKYVCEVVHRDDLVLL